MYPIKFQPILKTIIWGGSKICKFKSLPPQDKIGESWEISHVEDNVSIVAEGALKGKSLQELIDTEATALLGEKVVEKFGKKFPLLIKFIDACDDLSIQVHPDDKLAKARHNSFGKTEMWYVVDSEKDAKLISGFSKTITPEDYEKRVKDSTLIDVLNSFKVQPGDSFFIPAGRVHAIGAGLFVAEIQQTSNITYRIFDYNRKDKDGKTRELHTELAKDAINFNADDGGKIKYTPANNQAVALASCPYFTTNLIEANAPIVRNHSDLDSFVAYICMKGQMTVSDENGNKTVAKQGETVLIPAALKKVTLTPEPSCKALETYIK